MNRMINLLLKYHIISNDDIEIYQYGLFVIWFNSICIGLPIFYSYAIGEMFFAIIFFIFFIPIRLFLGGYHCQNPISCIIFFFLIYNFILFIYKIGILLNYHYYIQFILILACFHKIINADERMKISYLPLLLSLIMLPIESFFSSLSHIISMSSFLNVLLYLIPFLKASNTISN